MDDGRVLETRRKNVFGAITGKPTSLGGSAGRFDATAKGGLYAVREAAKKLGIELEDAKVAVQGFGNVGYHAAYLAKKLFGCRVVAVSDSKGAIYSGKGLDPEDVSGYKHSTGSVLGYPEAENLSNKELLELDVDILIPAALEDVVSIENAEKVRPKILAEMANGPTTREAEELLISNGVHIIPDILCNGGGAIVSYFENGPERVQHTVGRKGSRNAPRKKDERSVSFGFLLCRKKQCRHAAGCLYTSCWKGCRAMQLRGWI